MPRRRSTVMPSSDSGTASEVTIAPAWSPGVALRGTSTENVHLRGCTRVDGDVALTERHPRAEVDGFGILREDVELAAGGGEAVGGVEREMQRLLVVVRDDDRVLERAAGADLIGEVLTSLSVWGARADTPGHICRGLGRRRGVFRHRRQRRTERRTCSPRPLLPRQRAPASVFVERAWSRPFEVLRRWWCGPETRPAPPSGNRVRSAEARSASASP